MSAPAIYGNIVIDTKPNSGVQGFPVAQHQPRWGVDIKHGHFSVKMYGVHWERPGSACHQTTRNLCFCSTFPFTWKQRLQFRDVILM